VEKLSCFNSVSGAEQLAIWADLEILNQENIKINFKWQDLENIILLAHLPANSRANELWKQTCFEVFFREKNKLSYYEINLSTTKAWNFYKFKSYREPQPPSEFENIKNMEISYKINGEENQLTANILLSNLDLAVIEVSLCAMVQLKTGGTTYWSTRHADVKPNFHHANSFTLERKIQ